MIIGIVLLFFRTEHITDQIKANTLKRNKRDVSRGNNLVSASAHRYLAFFILPFFQPLNFA